MVSNCRIPLVSGGVHGVLACSLYNPGRDRKATNATIDIQVSRWLDLFVSTSAVYVGLMCLGLILAGSVDTCGHPY